MASQAMSSMSFVISATYTITFANSIYLMTVADPDKGFALTNVDITLNRFVCGTIAVIMTMRFFFGNNQYLEDIMSDSSRNPWIKFYHFMFIAIQSVFLLVCSYSVRDTVVFINGIIALFLFEVLWYLMTMVVDRKGVLPKKKEDRIEFALAESTNLAFGFGALMCGFLTQPGGVTWLWAVFGLFMANTLFDVKKNMKSYMGSK